MSTVTLDNKTILATGAAGFIGSNLVKRIYQEGSFCYSHWHRKHESMFSRFFGWTLDAFVYAKAILEKQESFLGYI